MNPWSDPDGQPGPPAPKRPGLGCLLAGIVTGLGLLVLLVLAINLVGSALSGVEIR